MIGLASATASRYAQEARDTTRSACGAPLGSGQGHQSWIVVSATCRLDVGLSLRQRVSLPASRLAPDPSRAALSSGQLAISICAQASAKFTQWLAPYRNTAGRQHVWLGHPG